MYRWDGSQLAPVLLRSPVLALPEIVWEQADRAVALAEADLWRQAAEVASLAASQAPSFDEVRWLSILINRMASARLSYAGSPGQPVLTNVFAGEYEAAVDLMRELNPAEAFALDGPLIVGTAAEQSLTTLGGQPIGLHRTCGGSGFRTSQYLRRTGTGVHDRVARQTHRSAIGDANSG